MSGEDKQPAETWPSKLTKTLLEHALKTVIAIFIAGVLGWLAIYLGGYNATMRCAFIRWYHHGICAVDDGGDAG